MRKFKILALFLLSAFAFTSCFDIVTEYDFNKNMSGTSRTYIDFSGMKSLDEFSKKFGADDDGESDFLGDSNTINLLNSLKGIDGLKEFTDTAKLHKGLTFEFDKLKTLNELYADTSLKGMMNSSAKSEMSYRKRTFRVQYNGSISKMYKELMDEKSEGDSTKLGDANKFIRMFFSNVNVVTRYKFSRRVKSTNNENSNILDDGKTVEQKENILDLLDGKVDMNQKIKLKRR
jgi:hypothetical protein